MRTSTWAQIEDDVRVRMDLPTFTANTKPTTTQLLRMGNQSLQARDAMLAEAYGDDYRSAEVTLATQAGLAYVSLPADFLKLRDLLWLRGADDPVRVHRASLEDVRDLSLLTARSWQNETPSYRFIGTSTIMLLPAPDSVLSLRLFYVQTTPALTTSADLVQDGPGWTEWLVADLCVKISTLREEDPSLFMAERAAAEARIRAQAPDRDEAQPYAVRDVTGEAELLGSHALRDWLTRYG